MIWIQNYFNILQHLKSDAFEHKRHKSSFICMDLYI